MITFSDIRREIGLDRRRWEQLWLAILCADAWSAGLSLHDIHWDDRSDAPDGGMDITIERGSQRGSQPLIPDRPSLWSVKSGANGVSPRTLSIEIEAEAHQALRERLQSGAVFYYCLCHSCGQIERASLTERARELESKHGFVSDTIRVLHADHLVRHLERHPGLLKREFPLLEPFLAESQSLVEWGRQRGPLFDPTVPFAELEGRSGVLEELVKHLNGDGGRPLRHIAGLSGVGKTRLVHEACKRSTASASVLYYASYVAARPMIARVRADPAARCTLVIDECSLTQAVALADELDECTARARVVSIGPASPSDRSRDFVIVVQPPERAAIEAVLSQVPVAWATRGAIASLAESAGHDLRYALLVWRVLKGAASPPDSPAGIAALLDDDEVVLTRVLELFRPRLGDQSSFLSLYKWLTLGRQIGTRSPRREEVQYLAKLADCGETSLLDVISRARECGLGESPAHLFEAIPRGLATRVFCRHLWPAIEPVFEEIFADAPSDSFRQAIIQRIELCPEPVRTEVASRVDRYFLRALGSPGVSSLGQGRNARLMRSWVELSPESGLNWLRSAIKQASHEQLIELRGQDALFGGPGPRREIVWAVSHLASFDEHYESCEDILFQLALSENESVTNNASGEWCQKQRLVLSNSETPYPRRIDVLLARMDAPDAASAPLLLSGFVQAVTIPYSEISPPAVIGGRLVPREWRPRGDWGACIVDAIRRGVAVLSRWQGESRALAVDRLIDSLELFCPTDALPVVREFLQIDRLPSSQRFALRSALEELVARSARAPDAELPRNNALADWLAEMRPESDIELVQSIVGRLPWEFDRITQSTAGDVPWREPYARAARLIADRPALLREIADWLESQSDESAHALGVALAERASSPEIIEILEGWLREARCSSLCVGYCLGHRALGGSAPAWALRMLDEQVTRHPVTTARITCVADPTERGFDRIMRCADQPGVDRSRVLGGVFGVQWDGVLTPDRMAATLSRLRESAGFPVESERVFVHLARMYLLRDEDRPIAEPLLSEIQFIVENPPTRSGGHVEHEWKDLALRVAKSRPDDVLRVAVRLAVEWQRTNGFANEEAVVVLSRLSSTLPSEVLAAVMRGFKASRTVPSFHLQVWQSLFAQFDPVAVGEELASWDAELVQLFGRLVPDAIIEADRVRVPPLTEWYLREHGSDEECLRQFDVGRWSGRVQSGWAWERTVDIEHETELLSAYPLPALRRWAQRRLSIHRERALRDRVDFEEMNQRG
ncbi:MAG: hypothetical protein KDA05_12075 [Phycisphaerales bacterium]|nr:hypothetical protein [Phycisphaerales bacterium]